MISSIREDTKENKLEEVDKRRKKIVVKGMQEK